jgi:hypothetical protein
MGGSAEDYTKNLFKLCCAILNYRPKQRDVNPIQDVALKFHLDQIGERIQDRETLIVD